MTVALEQEIADALEAWVITIMSEGRGPGLQVEIVTHQGKTQDNSWGISDVFKEIYRLCPDAISRMLQAGAAAYIKSEEHNANNS